MRAASIAASVRAMGPRIVVIGAGFAGLTAARGLLRRLGDAAEVTVIDTKDHFLYLPLLPEVTTGVVEPRHIAVSLARTLPGAKLVVATVDTIDVDGRAVHWTDADGDKGQTAYDRLVLTVGSVNRLLPIPGVCDHAPDATANRNIASRPVMQRCMTNLSVPTERTRSAPMPRRH